MEGFLKTMIRGKAKPAEPPPPPQYTDYGRKVRDAYFAYKKALGMIPFDAPDLLAAIVGLERWGVPVDAVLSVLDRLAQTGEVFCMKWIAEHLDELQQPPLKPFSQLLEEVKDEGRVDKGRTHVLELGQTEG